MKSFYSALFLVPKKNGKMRPQQVSSKDTLQNGHYKKSYNKSKKEIGCGSRV